MTGASEGSTAGLVDSSIRHRAVSSRRIGEKLVVARPLDGAPVVLASTAAIVWENLHDWTTPGEIDRQLAEAFPGISVDERETTRAQILLTLTNDDLVERR